MSVIETTEAIDSGFTLKNENFADVSGRFKSVKHMMEGDIGLEESGNENLWDLGDFQGMYSAYYRFPSISNALIIGHTYRITFSYEAPNTLRLYCGSGNYVDQYGTKTLTREMECVGSTELYFQSRAGVSSSFYIHNVSVKDMSTGVVTELGDIYLTGRTTWEIVEEETPIAVGGYYAKALGTLYAQDFLDFDTVDEGIMLANDYVNSNLYSNNQLNFESIESLTFSADTSFDILVESGGWYCPGNCHLLWHSSPSAGYAINVRGAHAYTTDYDTVRARWANYEPLSGFTIGRYNEQRLGTGLRIGHSDSQDTIANGVVTSKFKISRVNVFDFDDVLAFYPGVWGCELEHVNTVGGSWTTPIKVYNKDFGENIKCTQCFVSDNHARLIDGEMGAVHLRGGEWNFFGGSFDNMKVIADDSVLVTMYAPHFENPSSSVKNKRFLEVVGEHAHVVLDTPTIVIRNDEYYRLHNTLFWCVAGKYDANGENHRHPFAGGLVIKNPRYQSRHQYRPDMAALMSIYDGTTYDGEGYLELVGGGGRVYVEGGSNINSLFFTYHGIPIARDLADGKSIANHSFDVISQDGTKGGVGTAPLCWDLATTGGYVADYTVVTDEDSWVGSTCLKQTVWSKGATFKSAKASQRIKCSAGNLVVGYCKAKYVAEFLNGAIGDFTGQLIVALNFIDKDGNIILTGWSNSLNVNTAVKMVSTDSYSWLTSNSNESQDTNGWNHFELNMSAPKGTAYAEIILTAYAGTDSIDKKLHAYWDTVVFNVL
jgi:hypothetical protein